MKRIMLSTKRVLLTDKGYLRDVWEDYNDPNHDFTNDPLEAWDFTDRNKSPKYLGYYDDVLINTLEDACKYLKGRLVYIDIVMTTEWNIREVH